MRSAWTSWRGWYDSRALEYSDTSDVNIVSYLFNLFHDHGLAPATLGVHRAAISSFSNPLGTAQSESRLLRHFMKAAFSERPAACSCPHSTWDVARVLGYLHSLGPTEDLSLQFLSMRTLALFLIFSGRRISDLANPLNQNFSLCHCVLRYFM